MKYIIEIEDEPFVMGKETVYRAKGFKTLVFDKTGLDKLKPYDETEAEKAWELAGWVWLHESHGGSSVEEFKECFGDMSTDEVARLPYSEVVKKYEAWEKEKDEIRVGDEVRNPLADTIGIVLAKNEYGATVMWFDSDNEIHFTKYSNNGLVRTGRHFTEAVAMLRKMKGER